MQRAARFAAVAAVPLMAACGDSPSRPDPVVPPPPPSIVVPVNNMPVIESVAVQGRRSNEPANFADVSEIVDVTARVRDDETAAEQLQYNWTAPVGTFSGAGARVTWQAPPSATTPAVVTLTLELVERYGTNQEHRVTRTAAVALHNSAREVGDMARQFLLDFSDTNIKDASHIMRNFGTAATCPQPNEIQAERNDVTNHFTNFRMIEARIGSPSVTVNFGGSCPFRGKRGDACAVVPAYWHSYNQLEKREAKVDGDDIIAAAYSKADSRWWLCASDFDGRALLSPAASRFYLR